MEILWLAIVLYSVGVGLVLHLKPSLMFTEKGQWKEFGYQRGPRFTIFPFWLFAVLWGFCSYLLATMITWAVPALALTVPFVAFGSDDEDEEPMVPDDVADVPDELPAPVPETKRSRGRPRKVTEPLVFSSAAIPSPATNVKVKEKGTPGYYVLDTNSSGVRKYVYHGPDPPDMTELSEEDVFHEEG